MPMRCSIADTLAPVSISSATARALKSSDSAAEIVAQHPQAVPPMEVSSSRASRRHRSSEFVNSSTCITGTKGVDARWGLLAA